MGKYKYLKRESLFFVVEHRNDANLQLGFDYRKEVMKRTLSPILFRDEKRKAILDVFNDLIVYLIDSVKNIKKTFFYSIERNSRNLN